MSFAFIVLLALMLVGSLLLPNLIALISSVLAGIELYALLASGLLIGIGW
jgi:hypothetical protein